MTHLTDDERRKFAEWLEEQRTHSCAELQESASFVAAHKIYDGDTVDAIVRHRQRILVIGGLLRLLGPWCGRTEKKIGEFDG